MADRYIDEAYVFGAMEADVVRSILAPAGTSLTQIIERATSLVQSYGRNSGYTMPSTTDPTTITDETVKMAVMACVRQLLCAMPSSSLKLPEQWVTNPEYVAYRGILSGDAVLTLPLNTTAAVGAFKITTANASNGRLPRASSCQLKGW